jgi:hypothetical protein
MGENMFMTIVTEMTKDVEKRTIIDPSLIVKTWFEEHKNDEFEHRYITNY